MPSKTKNESEKPKKDTAKTNVMSDVSGPGKAAPSSTSRPIIVKHGSMVGNDPMVVSNETDQEKPAEALPAKLTVARELKIQPDKPPEDVTDAAPPKAAEKSSPGSAEKDAPPQKEASAPSGTGAVDSLMDEVDAKQADKKQKRELEERVRELEKSIESKEFFVPLGLESRRRSNNRILWLLILLIVISLAGVNFAVDAGSLDIGIEPLTDLL